MSVLDARIIDTTHGLETYLDLMDNIELKEIHLPTLNNPFYEIQFGIQYFRLTKGKYYDSQKNYFKIRMSSDFNSVILKETRIQSLFAVKSNDERAATKQLLEEWLIKTNSYRKSLYILIEKVKKENIYTGEDIQHQIKKRKFLEKLLELTTEDIQNAPVEK